MNFEKLNEMIKYIEKNLDNAVDFKKLSKITNTNIFILERIFMFLTGSTITEYIRKRRLSMAFEEIRNSDSKIIDIAIKYQYNSASSFNRAFKNLFGITPRECRKKVMGEYRSYPIEYFEQDKSKYNFDYRIVKQNTIELYCYHICSSNLKDLHYKIRELYDVAKRERKYEVFNKLGMYGIYHKKENTFHYYLGSSKPYCNLEKYKIMKNEFAEFDLRSRKQSDIVSFEDKINKRWIPSTKYYVTDSLKIEFYKGDSCFIYLPLNNVDNFDM